MYENGAGHSPPAQPLTSRAQPRMTMLYMATSDALNLHFPKHRILALSGVLEIRSIRVGVVALRALHTGFYVAMSRRGRLYGSRGRLYGSRVYTVHCRFQERIEENGYNTYASVRWHHRGRPMFLALDGRGAPRRGGRPQPRWPDTATPAVHPLPACPGLLRPQGR
ncbi:hypothetical protein CB1_000257009 [Camelus ferus]|nr:hypothetical protein CB1_000257009 [Camelus ferus]